jgi:hypothetical protein
MLSEWLKWNSQFIMKNSEDYLAIGDVQCAIEQAMQPTIVISPDSKQRRILEIYCVDSNNVSMSRCIHPTEVSRFDVTEAGKVLISIVGQIMFMIISERLQRVECPVLRYDNDTISINAEKFAEYFGLSGLMDNSFVGFANKQIARFK